MTPVPVTQGVTVSVSAPLWLPMPRPAMKWEYVCPGGHQTSAVSGALFMVLKGGTGDAVGGSLCTSLMPSILATLICECTFVCGCVYVRTHICVFVHVSTYLYTHNDSLTPDS